MTLPRRTSRKTRIVGKGPLLLALAGAVAFAGGAVGFVPSPGTDSRNQRDDSLVLRQGSTNYKVGMPRVPKGMEQRFRVSDVLINKDILMKLSEDGLKLREVYPGGRSFGAIWFAWASTFLWAGLFIVGISCLLKDNIVNWTDFTRHWLWMLKFNELHQPYPQGICMVLSGGIGLLINLFQAVVIWFNLGFGVGEFNKETGKYMMVRDNELLVEIDLAEIEQIIIQYEDFDGFWSGTQQLCCRLSNGNDIQVISEVFHNKATMEAKAVQLSQFLEVDIKCKGTLATKTNDNPWED